MQARIYHSFVMNEYFGLSQPYCPPAVHNGPSAVMHTLPGGDPSEQCQLGLITPADSLELSVGGYCWGIHTEPAFALCRPEKRFCVFKPRSRYPIAFGVMKGWGADQEPGNSLPTYCVEAGFRLPLDTCVCLGCLLRNPRHFSPRAQGASILARRRLMSVVFDQGFRPRTHFSSIFSDFALYIARGTVGSPAKPLRDYGIGPRAEKGAPFPQAPSCAGRRQTGAP